MKIVRGYGRSVVEGSNLAIRKIQKTAEKESLSFNDFVRREDAFILALWISVIDKIIAKPTKEGCESKNAIAKSLRQRISAAILSGKMMRANRADFARQWNWKITATSSSEQKGDFPKGRWYRTFLGDTAPEAIKDEQITELVHDIDKHIYQAVMCKENGKERAGSHGLLADILTAAEKNALAPAHGKRFPKGKKAVCAWTKEDVDQFLQKIKEKIGEGSDIADIVKKAIIVENAKAKEEKRSAMPAYNIAVQALREHIWENFSEDEKDKKFRKIYNAIKLFYKKLLKGRGNIAGHNVKAKAKTYEIATGKKRAGEKATDKLERILPDSTDKLNSILCKKHGNIDVNHYIRLGKVLHYTAAKISNENQNKQNGQDTIAAIIGHWGEAVKELLTSFYWSSEGQTHIKQNEAFVRVWRRALAFANRSLKDWADPEHKVQGDATIKSMWDKIEANFADASFEEKFGKKYELLFGKKWQGTNQTEILKYLQKRLKGLRGSIFHFKGMKRFVDELKTKSPLPHMVEFYQRDCESYRQKPIKIMRGAKFEQYFSEAQVNEILEAVQYWDAVSVLPEKEKELEDGQSLPLPTLKRVLKRVQSAWAGQISLPPYDAAAKKNEKADNQEKPENGKETAAEAAKHAQYIAIKMLYERPFRAWLADLPAERVNGYINEAVERATKDAQKIAGSAEKEFKDCIIARAAALPRLAHGQKIDRFFFNLTAATASEMRVQNDYQSDGEQAKKQAAYIENLKCDTVALALAEYLDEKREEKQEIEKWGKGFSYLVKKNDSAKTPEDALLLQPQLDAPETKDERERFWENIFTVQKKKDADSANNQKQDTSFKPWLYFLLHLVPVEEAASLRQQIRKWQITIGKSEDDDKEKIEGRVNAAKVRPLLQVLDLYIELHDEQFNTGKKKEQLQLSDEDTKQLEKYYEGNLSAVFEKQTQQDKLQVIRGLREMRRFGNHVLDAILQEQRHKVCKDSVDVWKNEDIAKAQKTRKALHKEWADLKKTGELGKEWWVTKTYEENGKNKTKEVLGEKGKQYADALQIIIKHKEAAAQVELQNHLHLHKLLMMVLGRLVDFSGLFERDLYFTMLALFYEAGVEGLEEQFTDTKSIAATEIAVDKEQLFGSSYLEEGRIPEAFAEKLHEGNIKDRLKKIFSLTALSGGGKGQGKYDDLADKDVLMWVRNRFAHLAVLERRRKSEGGLSFDIDLTRELNFARALMSYDRKLKNALAKSISDMLKRNKLEITWQMGDGETNTSAAPHIRKAYEKIKKESGYYLFDAKVESRIIYHLGNSKIEDLQEKLQSREFVSMVQMLFSGANKIKPDREAMSNGKKTGVVKCFNVEKGFGFIKPDDGSADIFVHISAVQASGLQNVQEAQKVSFATEADKGGKGPKAVNISLTDKRA